MMSLEAIRRVNTEIAVKAAEEGLIPYVPFDADEVDSWPPIPFPNLGTFVPDDWERTDTTWFVDNTGHGHDWEPALTAEQFKRQLRAYIAENPGDGFAITEEGPCQVYVTVFRPAWPWKKAVR
jgi:hypothetical protein